MTFDTVPKVQVVRKYIIVDENPACKRSAEIRGQVSRGLVGGAYAHVTWLCLFFKDWSRFLNNYYMVQMDPHFSLATNLLGHRTLILGKNGPK